MGTQGRRIRLSDVPREDLEKVGVCDYTKALAESV